LEAKAEGHPSRRPAFSLGQLSLRPPGALEQFGERLGQRLVASDGHRDLPKLKRAVDRRPGQNCLSIAALSARLIRQWPSLWDSLQPYWASQDTALSVQAGSN